MTRMWRRWTMPLHRPRAKSLWNRREEHMRVGIAGLGAIGRSVARKIANGAIAKIELVGVTVRDGAKARCFLDEIGCSAPVLSLAELIATSDLIVECAPAAVMAEIAAPVLAAGKM